MNRSRIARYKSIVRMARRPNMAPIWIWINHLTSKPTSLIRSKKINELPFCYERSSQYASTHVSVRIVSSFYFISFWQILQVLFFFFRKNPQLEGHWAKTLIILTQAIISSKLHVIICLVLTIGSFISYLIMLEWQRFSARVCQQGWIGVSCQGGQRHKRAQLY